MKNWQHPGGKLRRLSPADCTDKELLAIIIGSGVKGKSAEQIADEIIDKYHSVYGLMGKSLAEIEKIKGLKLVKATRLAAVFELARRIVKYLEKQ
ncbi:MAG: hypothetical protein QME51_02370 [Planctomycetota bacterium]|nr:hypothetical protein [Planctomycetota bacterium]MDI6787199.1 hypothetical protein [Planctomycetota bacterium]